MIMWGAAYLKQIQNSVFMNMSMQDYNALSLAYKVLLLEKDATFVSYYMDLDYTISLYFYNNYYIELLVDNSTNDLTNVLAFNNTWQLEKYLSDILLSELLQEND